MYNENIQLKQKVNKTGENIFIRDCEEEINRLRSLVETLMENQGITNGPSEREEIKDRIIMKLEDELIAAKIELK